MDENASVHFTCITIRRHTFMQWEPRVRIEEKTMCSLSLSFSPMKRNKIFRVFYLQKLHHNNLFFSFTAMYLCIFMTRTQVDDSGLRNLPEPTRNDLFSALFRMDPLSFQLYPAGNHTGSWKQYSGPIPSYRETGKSGKFPLPDSIRKQEGSEREISRKSTLPFGTWPEKFVSQPDVS